jgi:hypothetical protein
MSSDERGQRLAENERLFEAVNAAIRDVNERLGVSDQSEQYLCECSLQDCMQRVSLTPEEYAEARSSPERFFMVAAHRDPVHEVVVRTTDRYVLVEKKDRGDRHAA